MGGLGTVVAEPCGDGPTAGGDGEAAPLGEDGGVLAETPTAVVVEGLLVHPTRTAHANETAAAARTADLLTTRHENDYGQTFG